MIIGTAGHIDHGKTALVRALTGVDTDRLPEEKRRGITIELGFAPLILDGVGTVGLVDVPGHEAFIRTMLAGATGIDLALLVIAADEGIMPQTREHLSILTLLGVQSGVVALTKRDAADDEWVALVREDIDTLLATTPWRDVPIVETSARSGAGIDTLRATLRDRLLTLPERSGRDVFRMPIDRAFTVKGTGTVVTGTVWSGTVDLQTQLRLFPLDRAVRARGVQSHGTPSRALTPGTRAAVALAGVELDDVSRGGMLVEEGAWIPSRVFRADVALLDDAGRPLRPREWVRLHLGTSEVGARIVVAGGMLAPGETRGARVVLDAPLVARAGDRFVLRLPSPPTTIGGGIVADPSPLQCRPRPWLPSLDADDRLRLVLEEGGERGVSVATLPIRLGLPRDACDSLRARLHGIERDEETIYASAVVARVREHLREAVDRFHLEHPLEEWASRSAVRAAVPVAEKIGVLALGQLLKDGSVEQGAGGLRRPGWTPVMSDFVQRERDWLLGRLRTAAAEPPSVAELRSEREGNDPTPLLRILERERLVVPVESDRFYSAESVRELVERLHQKMEPGKVYGPAELRQIVGSSRKFLIPFLEYCDRQRVTERRLEGRVLGE
ncbi:MAG: selenocysteine-specific translation elongation factor [Gemmatimonadota bacterium]